MAFVLLALLFPYVSVIPTGSDTQPWALIGSLFLLFLWSPRIVGIHIALFLMCAAASLMLLTEGGGLGAVRNLLGYVSMFTIAVIATQAMRDEQKVARLIDIAIIAWLVVGLVQRIIYKDAFTFLVWSARTDASRGVIGLSPEPTYFASMVLLMVLWRSLIGIKRWHIVALVVVTIALASSSQVFLVLLGASTVAAIAYWRRYLWLSASLAIIAASGIAFFIQTAKESRISQLIVLALDNPGLILSQDQSANERFVHIFAGLYSVVAHGGVPAGILSVPWTIYVNRVIHEFPGLLWVPQGGDRIMSAMGALFYQMGFLCAPLIIGIIAALVRWREDARFKMIWAAAFALIMLTALPLGHPLIGCILGGLAFKAALTPTR